MNKKHIFNDDNMIGKFIAIILAVSTILGGLFIHGRTPALVVILLVLIYVLISIRYRRKRQMNRLPFQFRLNALQFESPVWLQKDDKDKLLNILKAAFILLSFDRMNSGLWGKTYLYRLKKAGVSIPKSQGSLGGTPIGLWAITANYHSKDSFVSDWLFPPLINTLSSTRSHDGKFIKRSTYGDLGSEFEYEPERHAAGGLLISLFYNKANSDDMKTLEYLLSTTPLDVFGKALMARTLFHIYYMKKISKKYRVKAKKKSLELIKQLIEIANNTELAMHIWLKPHKYGRKVNNMWASLWALLPLITIEDVNYNIQQSLVEVLIRIMRSHIGVCVSETSLFPSYIAEDGIGHGEYVFGTAVSLMVWRTIEVYNNFEQIVKIEDIQNHIRDIVGRLLSNQYKLITIPSTHEENKAVELEGYFAWAAVCIAMSSLGIKIFPDFVVKSKNIVELFEDYNAIEIDEKTRIEKYSKLLSTNFGLPESTINAIATSSNNIVKYQQVINANSKE